MILENQLYASFQKTNVKFNSPVPKLVETALRRNEGTLTNTGALSVLTGKYTGRSPNDKYFVQSPEYNEEINWGPINQPMSQEQFKKIYEDVLTYLAKNELFVSDGFAGADPQYRLSLRIVNDLAWQNLFIKQLLIRPSTAELSVFKPDYHIICVPGFKVDPLVHKTNSETVIAINLAERIIIICGSSYAGEIKKSIFSLANYILPKKNVLSMHCSANIGDRGDTALFFGLSGTGKTTLSADPNRHLVGDDEHGWSDRGIFNIEGGCYAKCIGLDPLEEPQIWEAIRFGSVLENVVIDELTCTADFQSDDLTENTRSAYPVNYIPNPVIPGIAGHPKNIFFLTADAFGVLPPIARLNSEQAMYHFMSGYTSKLAGTERDIHEPQATFSECFGAPFLPLSPVVYAHLLGDKLRKHGTQVYLVNTGWTGGPYGVGQRFKISYTRAIIKAVLEGQLNQVPYRKDAIFGFDVPQSCPGVPDSIFNPKSTWPNPDEYEAQACKLAALFVQNFNKFQNVPDSIKNAAPQIK